MADDQTKECRSKHKVDKALRRTRDRFGSSVTQLALKEAILEVPGVKTSDVERVVFQLGERLSDFKHIAGFRQFRTEIVAWVTRQARFIPKLRELMRELWIDGHVATLLFLRLPEFVGTDDEFRQWVTETAKHEEDGLEALALWIRIHASAVRRGIKKITKECRDLEGCIRDVEDELFSVTWMYVANHASMFIDTSDLPRKLKNQAMQFARDWKKERLKQVEDGSRPKPAIGDGVEKLESIKAYYAKSGKLPPRPVVLGTDDYILKKPAPLIDPSLDGFCSLAEYHNRPTDEERRWTDADLQRELRRAGPFRADDVYDKIAQQMPIAA